MSNAKVPPWKRAPTAVERAEQQPLEIEVGKAATRKEKAATFEPRADALPAGGAARVRGLFIAQERHGRVHPSLRLPAPPYALRFRPIRSTTPTIGIDLIADAKRIARWVWKLDRDVARPT